MSSPLCPSFNMAFRLILALALCATAAYAGTPWVAAPRDANWIHHHEQLVNLTKHHAAEVKVVFLGDSITAGWAGNGKHIWAEHYANRGAFNYGIGGDRTEHILYRIEKGEFDDAKLNPKLVVLKIGTNNIHTNGAADIAKGIHTILEALHAKMPHAKVLLLSVLPRQPANMDTIVHDINKIISRFADNTRVHYLDLAVHFELSLGKEKVELFVPDHVHLTAAGYEMWYRTMEPSFKKLIA